MPDWKDFLLANKWVPSEYLVRRFGIHLYDVDNFKRKPGVREVLEPWRIGPTQSPERMRAILTAAWRFYLCDVVGLQVDQDPRLWVPRLIALKNISRGSESFGFLVNSRYLRPACPDEFAAYKARGFTNVALATHEFWPGKERLRIAGVLPFMFLQTHRDVLNHVDPASMLEHVYFHFLADDDALASDESRRDAKERLCFRHNEPGFLPQKALTQYGVPSHFFRGQGGLRAVLRGLAAKYAAELDYSAPGEGGWSPAEFRRRFSDRQLDRCEYCGLQPVDLHHLVFRHMHPELAYVDDNVVPLCVQAHGYVTRRLWSPTEEALYDQSVARWLGASDRTPRRVLFREVMGAIHSSIYGAAS